MSIAHNNSTAMARVLVQYIADPYRVRKIVHGEFNQAPDLTTIAAMRARYERPKDRPAMSRDRDLERHVAHMERANKAFVEALKCARPSN